MDADVDAGTAEADDPKATADDPRATDVSDATSPRERS